MTSRDDIMSMAKEIGVRSTELIALAPQNDPFYCGMPAQDAAARWFGDLWQRYDFRHGVHLRRIHYQIISVEPLPIMPDGEPYQNTDKCWRYLVDAGKFARYLGYVDPDSFADRRNPTPAIFTEYTNQEPGISVARGDWLPSFDDIVDLPELDRPSLVAIGYGDVFPGWHVEIWAEKTTMNDVLEPLCRRQRVNLVTGAGELSITSAMRFLQRVEASGRPARILYVADFDPAGMGMPISVSRKIEYYQQQRPDYADLDIRLLPVVLTVDQVENYRLPRTPIKDSDMRKERWTEDFGAGAVELDALEANHPGVLARILRDAVNQFRDYSLRGRAADTETDLQERLDEMTDDVMRQYGAGDLVADYETLQNEIRTALHPFADRWGQLSDKWHAINGVLFEAMQQEADTVDLADYPLPGPELPPEPPALYDSRRDYWEQLDYYRAHRRNGNGV